MATFLAGAWEVQTGEQPASGEVLFDDIEGNVHAEAIAAITAVGWTGGTAPGIYEPGRAVTRAQMGTFLARWLTTRVEEEHAGYPPANPVPIPERPDNSTDDAGDDTEEPAEPDADYCAQGGEAELVWVHEQEPPDLHLDAHANNLSTTSWLRQAIWEGVYGISPATSFIPELLDTESIEETNEGWRTPSPCATVCSGRMAPR